VFQRYSIDESKPKKFPPRADPLNSIIIDEFGSIKSQTPNDFIKRFDPPGRYNEDQPGLKSYAILTRWLQIVNRADDIIPYGNLSVPLEKENNDYDAI
jgi:hypothetical protein